MRAGLLVLITFLCSQAALAESVRFETCAESSTWMRPSPELQANKIWKDTRYKSIGKNSYAWIHDFLVFDGYTHTVVTLTNLSGLWTAKTQWVHQCYLDQERSIGSWIPVVLLLHRVKEIQRQDNTYTFIVEPSGKGFQWIFVRRVSLNAFVMRFVTPEGNELEKWDESGPPEDFNGAMPQARTAAGDRK